jgi:hypothetical protein
MRTLLRAGLVLAGLGSACPAFAGSWSLLGAYQHFDVSAEGDATGSRDGYALGASYWFTPSLAVDLGVASSDDVTLDPANLATTRNLRSLSVGGRKQWTIAPQWTIDAAAGVDLLRVEHELVRIDPIDLSPSGSVGGVQVSFYQHRRQDLAPYVGIGLGWHPDPDWTIRVDARRSLPEIGVTCRVRPAPLPCSDSEGARLDSLRFGFEYRFR